MYKVVYLDNASSLRKENEYIVKFGSRAILNNKAIHKKLFEQIDYMIIKALRAYQAAGSTIAFSDLYGDIQLVDYEIKGLNEDGKKVCDGCDKELTARGLSVAFHEVIKARFLETAEMRYRMTEHLNKKKENGLGTLDEKAFKELHAELVKRGIMK